MPNMTNQILFINLVLRETERDPETGSKVVRLTDLGSFRRNLGKKKKKAKTGVCVGWLERKAEKCQLI